MIGQSIAHFEITAKIGEGQSNVECQMSNDKLELSK